MSLDRQRILNELGSVVNQLQSADCGCMGKLFSNQNQTAPVGSPPPMYGGCRRGCCHGHGYSYGTPCAGEPFSMNHAVNRPCMGQCNPPKLYADTYSYLNNNLMQPVMKEVYDDLKGINPGNTVMNSPLGNQMGLSQGNPGTISQGNVPSSSMGMHNMSGMESNNAKSMVMEQSRQPMNAMGGMGPQIVNMIMGDSGAKSSNAQGMQGGQLTGHTVIDAPQSPHGKIGLTPINPMGENQVQNSGNMNSSFNPQGNMGSSYGQNPTAQFMTQQPKMYSGTNAQGNIMVGNVHQNPTHQMGSMNNSGNPQMSYTNPATQQMSPTNRQYGQHTPGVTKFNEMFPGVMQGGDLGFDPMAIAIQMNPANQQKAAMDTMQKLMTGGPAQQASDRIKSAMQSINPSTAPANQNQQNTNQIGNQQMPSGQYSNINPVQNANQQIMSGQQHVANPNAGNVYSQPSAVPQQQQQVYTAIAGAEMPNQQQQNMPTYQQQSNPMQQYQQPQSDTMNQYQQPQTQYFADPNTGATVTPPSMPNGYNEGMIDLNAQKQSPHSEETAPQTMSNSPQPMIKEPIFPADTSRNRTFTYSNPVKHVDYNTLGQPVEMLPAKMFHPQEPGLPQTLSPQPTTKPRNDYIKFSNVKSTISKTSLMGNRPVGRTPSRNQLQNIYNQYKGSQSFTQQSVRPPVQGGTYSEGKLNVPISQTNAPQQIPIEKVGGDTSANNQVASNHQVIKAQPMGHNVIGDVPVSNKPQEVPIKSSSPIPERQAKLRNGLQDVAYTSYPTSAAWSFHGGNSYHPNVAPVGYRFRNIR